MFSTVLAYSVFGLVSLIGVLLIIERLWVALDSRARARQQLEEFVTGRRMKYDFFKLSLLFVIWAASGIYIWG